LEVEGEVGEALSSGVEDALGSLFFESVFLLTESTPKDTFAA
jgi:hypothetical protein